jgi:hypothetical protein
MPTRGRIGAGGGRSKPVRLGVRDTHTLSLRAQSSAKLSNGVAGFAEGGSSLNRGKSRRLLRSQRCRSMPQLSGRVLSEDPGSTRPELRIAKLKRERSLIV